VRISRLVDDLLSAVLPGGCPCGTPGEPCCARCEAGMRTAPEAPPPAGVDWWAAAFAYEGTARELVARAKYRSARVALAWLARALAERVGEVQARELESVDVVTWVPASRARRHSQGVDHGELLARAVALRLSLPVRALLRRPPGPAQTGAAPAVRRHGPRLAAVANVEGISVLVVDDVATTGATLTSAACALRRHGAPSVAAATAARTPPPRHR
jgi:predicted amidophosphoribosyltransferase